MTAFPRWLLALAGGAVWGLCFGERVWSLAPWLALVPLLLLLGKRHAAALGWAHGVSFWLVSIPWIVPTLQNYGQLPGWLAVLSLLSLAGYLALFSGLFAGAGSFFWRRGGPLALAAIPAIWVVVEWLRGHLFTGFPWNLAAYAWIEVPGALELSAWVGPWGVAYLLVLANTGIAVWFSERRWRPAALSVGVSLLVLALAARWAIPEDHDQETGRPLMVRLLQPNNGILAVGDPVAVEAQYQQMLEMSREACDLSGVLVIWPESATWPYSYSRHERLRNDLAELAEAGCPILVNTSMAGEGGVFNTILLVDKQGIGGRYDKRHLVPFGEYVPMSGWLPFLQKIARNAGEFLAGNQGSLLAWGGQRLAPAICFEITFPGEVAEQIRRGGTVLVTVTNDAWYGDSWAPWQHFRAARFRAAESRRYLLRAAITGISAIVRPDGSVEEQLGVGDRGILRASIPGLAGVSPFSRAPWLVPLLCLIVVAFAIFRSRKGWMKK